MRLSPSADPAKRPSPARPPLSPVGARTPGLSLIERQLDDDPDVTADTPRGLSVCMVPYCLDNPYQRELAAHLRGMGSTVTARDHLNGLTSDLRAARIRLDVVHLHWLRTFTFRPLVVLRILAFLLRLSLLRRCGCGVVWTVHNLYGHEARHPWMERMIATLVARRASRLIVHAPSAAELVAKEFKITDRSKIAIIPHGNYIGCYPNEISREEARARLGLPADAVVLLFLGKIRRYKGVPELIETFQSIDGGDARLVVAGSPLNPQVEKEVRDAVRSEHVHLHPNFVPDGEIQVYMNAADAVVLPYQDVLTSGAVVLAMSFGKACIAAKIGCIPDMLDDAGAILYDPDRSDGLREALKQALAAPDRLARMGEHNAERAREWGWDRVARETDEVYRQAIEE